MLAFLSIVIVATAFGAASIAQAAVLNAPWWKQASRGEQIGFVVGFYDCPHPYGTVQFATSDDYRRFLDIYLDRHPTTSVPDALRRAHSPLHPGPRLRGGEEYPEAHGWLDGEWWGDASHGDPDDRIGYVEGYLACEYRTPQPIEVSRYVAALNRHFGNERNEHDKIANVLQPILDREKRRQ